MPHIIKAFAVMPSMVDNSTGAVATVGELSAHSLTFAFDQTLYADDRYPSNELTVFSSKNNGTVITPPEAILDKAQDVIEKTFNDYDGVDAYLTFIGNAFNDISNVSSGSIVLQQGRNIPRWIQFDFNVNGSDITIKVWMSDETFRNEYDEHEIIVIPPVVPITGLYQPHNLAKPINDTADINSFLSRAENERAKRPFTSQRSYTLRWQDPSDNSLTFDTDWLILGYGAQALREDNILAAIRQYLIDNTPNTVIQWRAYLPEILAEDTIYIIPVWNKVSVTAGPNSDTLYSPITDYVTATNLASQVQPSRTNSEIVDFLEFGSSLYKSLGIIFLGSGKNALGIRKFTDKYPRYTVVGLNNQAINAIPGDTLTIMRELEALLLQADIDDGANALPSAVSRAIEGDFTILRKTIAGVIYRVVTRRSFLATV